MNNYEHYRRRVLCRLKSSLLPESTEDIILDCWQRGRSIAVAVSKIYRKQRMLYGI